MVLNYLGEPVESQGSFQMGGRGVRVVEGAGKTEAGVRLMGVMALEIQGAQEPCCPGCWGRPGADCPL